jgi:YD repeat-containing protein
MKCLKCHFEMSGSHGLCPHCGFRLTQPVVPASLGSRRPALLISLCLLAVLILASAVGFFVYRAKQARIAAYRSRVEAERADKLRLKKLEVEHGNSAGAPELHAHGKLYFAPVGRQAISLESLAEYYRQKFGIEITTLPPVQLPASACVPDRSQCIAEEVIAAMSNTYPEIARNSGSMIAFTDEDIFSPALGWDFTYSFHSARIGVISTRRMDPSFWGDPPDNTYRLAATKQMITKYIGLQYFHLTESLDPSSVLFSPLTPDGGSDDIYESDLHPEASANGQRGTGYPCFSFTYSYQEHSVKPEQPFLYNCEYHNPVNSTDEEIFETDLLWAQFTQRSLDLQLDSSPSIEFKRGYNSAYNHMGMTFGWGGNHSYNQWLSSDGLASLSYMQIKHEDEHPDYFGRQDSKRGYDPFAIYESHDNETYGARITSYGGYYKLLYRNGDNAKFSSCTANSHCYWFAYQDARGSLTFDRGSAQELRQLRASDHQGINLELDGEQRTTKATATNGASISYEYDDAGCLARVYRMDGQITLYGYDPEHRMQSISVAPHAGAEFEQILAVEYDSGGRVVKETLRGIGTYQIQYVVDAEEHVSSLQITTPEGEILEFTVGQKSYLVRSAKTQFPYKQP